MAISGMDMMKPRRTAIRSQPKAPRKMREPRRTKEPRKTVRRSQLKVKRRKVTNLKMVPKRKKAKKRMVKKRKGRLNSIAYI